MADNAARPVKLSATQAALYQAWVAAAGGYGPEHTASLAEVRAHSGRAFPRLWTLSILRELGLLLPATNDAPPSLVQARFYATERPVRH